MKYVFQFWSCTPHLEASIEIALNEALLVMMYYISGVVMTFIFRKWQGKFGQTFSIKTSFQAMRLSKRNLGMFWI